MGGMLRAVLRLLLLRLPLVGLSGYVFALAHMGLWPLIAAIPNLHVMSAAVWPLAITSFGAGAWWADDMVFHGGAARYYRRKAQVTPSPRACARGALRVGLAGLCAAAFASIHLIAAIAIMEAPHPYVTFAQIFMIPTSFVLGAWWMDDMISRGAERRWRTEKRQ
jgi:hypothetical protein